MPAIQFADLIPLYPLHWTTIIRYVALLIALGILIFAGDEANIMFTLVLAMFAIVIGADLYSPMLHVSRLFIFLIRVLTLALPLVIAGMAPTEGTRGMGFILVAIGIPLLGLMFLTCVFGPTLGDPRVWGWCV